MVSINPRYTSLYFVVLTLLIFSIIPSAFAQSFEVPTGQRNLYFYGPSVDASDTSKVQLSTDLYYSQFQLNNDFVLHDRRSIAYETSVLEQHNNTNDVIFYNVMRENNKKWYSSLFLIDFATKKEVTVKYVYDDYYKILLEAKGTIEELLLAYVSTDSQELAPSAEVGVETVNTITVSSLFGTWKAENYIDKIVILRGGKGFVIFDNGASMNISVEVSGNLFIARQESNSNASFFPELPREVALVKALDVKPIVWELNIESEDLLVGVKQSYSASENASGEFTVVEATIPTRWYR